MDVPSAPTKSGNGRLTHPKALAFYFGLHVLSRNDHNPAHRSNWPPQRDEQRVLTVAVRAVPVRPVRSWLAMT